MASVIISAKGGCSGLALFEADFFEAALVDMADVLRAAEAT